MILNIGILLTKDRLTKQIIMIEKCYQSKHNYDNAKLAKNEIKYCNDKQNMNNEIIQFSNYFSNL